MRNPFTRLFRASVDEVPWRPTNEQGWPWYTEDDFTLLPWLHQTLLGNEEQLAPDYLGFVLQAYKASPVVYSCIANRANLFSEARFQYRRFDGGRPGDLFGDQSLAILEHPWPGGTTGDLLSIAELNNSLAGNFFCARRNLGDGDRIRIMRPDWTVLVLGSDQQVEGEEVYPCDLDAEVIGYIYMQGGAGSGRELALLPEEVCHFAPMRDPLAPWRGMSWLTPVIQEVLADKTLTQHKRKYLDAGATPNLAINLDPARLGIKNTEDFEKWVDKFQEKREGRRGNPYRTLFLAAGADPIPLGANLGEIDFSKVQGGGEVRIAAAAMVHPAIAGFSEGLQGSALNSGNLAEAYRQFANNLIRPNWRNLCGSLETIVPPPTGASLWYDDRDVPALQEDTDKRAGVQQKQAQSIRQLVDAGFTPDSVVDAVAADDLRRLKHSGLYSVQLQPAGAQRPAGTPPAEAPAAEGNGHVPGTELVLHSTATTEEQ